MALWKNTDTQDGKPKHLALGQVEGFTITGTMTGYVDGAALTIGAPGGTGIQAVGIIKVTGGVITGYTLTNPGAGYTSAPTITAPTGSGATLVAKIYKNRAGLTDNADIVFVSREESLLTINRAKGIKGPGWYKITERLSGDNTNSCALRYMTECLASLDIVNAISGDGPDDAVVGDNELVFTTQPSPSSVSAPAIASFSVVATGTSPTYQWQLRTGGQGAYINITNAGVYTNATTTTLNISNSTGLNGNFYRCVATNSGGTAVAKSKGVSLTVA